MDRATRQILHNQLEILKLLNPSQADSYSINQDVLESGYTSQYDELFVAISPGEADEMMQHEVRATLDMFRALHHAKQNGWTPSDASAAEFEGFDANNDDHYFFASHLIDKRGLYAESAPNKNSHSIASRPRYQRMVEAWKASGGGYELTGDQAEAILSA